MKDFFSDIFAYHHHFNQELADIFSKNSYRISDRTIPLFSHMINAHQIWNSRILQTHSLGVNDIHTLEKCKNLDDLNIKETLKILEDFDLNTKISYQNTRKQPFENSILEILYHVANHFSHHKGQLISDLRENGIEPPITDYIFYKR